MKINAYKKMAQKLYQKSKQYGGKWANFQTKAKKKTQKPNFHFFFQKTQKRNISIHISISLNHQKSNNYKNLLFYSISCFLEQSTDLFYMFGIDQELKSLITRQLKLLSFQYTVEGKVAYAPAVARLECGFFPNDPHGFWQENGYGLLSVFKVDWDRFGGKYESCHSGEENSQLWAVPVGYVPLNKVCFLFVSESRAGYQNHPLSLQEVSFVSTF